MAHDPWTPDRIRNLRKKLKMSQAAFGQEIWDASPATAQKNVSRLENGHVEPSAAVRRTLQRLERLAESDRPDTEWTTLLGYDILDDE
ncbi:MAG: helix-turn-helix domain-containing protein [Salinibacter sp.]